MARGNHAPQHLQFLPALCKINWWTSRIYGTYSVTSCQNLHHGITYTGFMISYTYISIHKVVTVLGNGSAPIRCQSITFNNGNGYINFSVIKLLFLIKNLKFQSGFFVVIIRDYFVYAPSQWETTLQCNVVSHWLGAHTKWSLDSGLILRDNGWIQQERKTSEQVDTCPGTTGAHET